MKITLNIYLKNLLAFIIAIRFSLLCFAQSNSPSQKVLETISAKSAREHLSYLASDKMKGRNSPSPELVEAGNYIMNYFKSIGLQSINGKYFQSFYLRKINLGPLDKNRIAFISSSQETTRFEIKKDFVPFSETSTSLTTSEIIFAGYGIRDSIKQYDDYSHINVKDKIVVVLNGEPRFDSSSRTNTFVRPSVFSRMSTKIKNAVVLGAAGIIIINDIHYGRSITPRGYPWPQLNPIFKSSPTITPTKYDNKIAVMNIGEKIVKKLFGSVHDLQLILHRIDSLRVPQSFIMKGTMLIESNVDIEPIELRNIVGLLSGTDEKLKDEIVVIGAHYDHVGSKEVPEGQDGIYNGADDNASGTTGMMEIAKAYMINPSKPKRSTLFIAFAAEEKGLLGSRAYAANPLFPLKNHVAMFNLDMIGRNYPDSLSIGGESRCAELKNINEEENKKIGFTLAYNIEHFFFRSDQASFAQEKIPVIFYFTGEHNDYHKVTDEADKINYDKLVRVARLCFLTSLRVTNLDHRLIFTESK